MEERIEQKTDCEVCKKLIKEKHNSIIWWKIFCAIFAITTIVFGILYFGKGAIITETQVSIDKSQVSNTGENGTIVIGGEETSDSYNGKIQKVDYTPIICITVLGSVVALIIGGGIIANHISKKSKD